ncbi:hypothetical protein V8C86DRAFT_3132038 [Haematococcus lacustris]
MQRLLLCITAELPPSTSSRLSAGWTPTVSERPCGQLLAHRSLTSSLPHCTGRHNSVQQAKPWSSMGLHRRSDSSGNSGNIIISSSSSRWMKGRFVMDRNGTVWHKQANRNSHRHYKSSTALDRLRRLKPLPRTMAANFRRLPGVKQALKYWADPVPSMVPGFEGGAVGFPPRRRDSVNKKMDGTGDPALVPH